jgi:hypothetical protein
LLQLCLKLFQSAGMKQRLRRNEKTLFRGSRRGIGGRGLFNGAPIHRCALGQMARYRRSTPPRAP